MFLVKFLLLKVCINGIIYVAYRGERRFVPVYANLLIGEY